MISRYSLLMRSRSDRFAAREEWHKRKFIFRRLGWGHETLRLRGHCPSACRATPNKPKDSVLGFAVA